MRVLTVGNMYPPHHLGGYELMWRAATEELRSAGHRVRVLTTDYRADRADTTLAEDPDVRRDLRWYWRDHEFPRLPLRERLALERHNQRVLTRSLADLDPHVVSWWAMGGMSMALIERVRRTSLPALGFVHDDWMLYGPKVDAWQRALARLGPMAAPAAAAAGAPALGDLGAAARWVFVSEACRRHAERRWEMPETAIVHSGVDTDLFRPAAERRGWSGALLYVGRIDPRKGIDVAVRALEHLPEATLTVVGSGDDEHLAELRRIAGDAGASDRVTFRTAARDEVPEIYAAGDAAVFPVQWEEPWGLVPLEAMAVGRPVIATGRGGSGEFLRDGQNSLLYEPADDPRALADAVRRLAGDASLRAKLRAGGSATASRHDERSFRKAAVEQHEIAVERSLAK
jgi:glycogen(starch) synthase